MKLHEKIRMVRKVKRFSQVEIAKRARMTVTTYNMKEMGNRSIRADEIEDIAKALEVNPSIFFEKDFHEKWKFADNNSSTA